MLYRMVAWAARSVAVFGLAASLAAVALASRNRVTRVTAVVCLLVAVALLLAGDIHGESAAVGAASGFILASVDRRAVLRAQARHTNRPAG